MTEIQEDEDLKQCAIYSYGKSQQLPEGYVCTNHYENSELVLYDIKKSIT